MKPLSRRALLAGLGLCAGAGAARAQGSPEAPGGMRPGYTQRALSAVPNRQAILRRFWVPGLDEGYVPQGLTVFGAEVLVASYLSADPKQDRGPSRVFRLSRTDGRLLGMFDLPPAYGHPGGLAMRGSTLYAADSGKVLALRLPADPARAPEQTGEWRIARGMGPSFLASNGAELWFGPYRREGEASLYAVPFARLAAGRTEPIAAADAARILPLPLFAQGGCFDAQGKLWISASSGNRPARLYRIDPVDGRVLATYAAPGGIEDLGLAEDGRIWAASEAGSRRWNGWETFFPLVFEIDPDRLEKLY